MFQQEVDQQPQIYAPAPAHGDNLSEIINGTLMTRDILRCGGSYWPNQPV